MTTTENSTDSKTKSPPVLVFELGTPGVREHVNLQRPFRRGESTVAYVFSHEYDELDRLPELVPEEPLSKSARAACDAAFGKTFKALAWHFAERLGFRPNNANLSYGYHNDGTLAEISAAFEKSGFEVVPLVFDPLPGNPIVADVIQAASSADALDERYKATRKLIRAIESAPETAGALVTDLLADNLGPNSRVNPVLRASKARQLDCLKEGWNPHGVAMLALLNEIGERIIGKRFFEDETKKTARLARADRVVASFAKASASWTDDMLWLFLHACIVRKNSGDGFGAKELAENPVVKELLKVLPTGTGGEGAALLANMTGKRTAKIASAKPSKKAALTIPEELPDDMKAALGLIEALPEGTIEAADPAPAAEIHAAEAALGDLPTPLRAFYKARHSLQSASFTVVRPEELFELQRDFLNWVEQLLEDPDEPGDVGEGLDLQSFKRRNRLIPFAKENSVSTYLFVDPKAKDKPLPVYRFEHDQEGPVCPRERTSIAAAVAAIALEALAANDPTNEHLATLLGK